MTWSEIRKRYTNCFVETDGKTFVSTVKMQFKDPISYDEAKKYGALEMIKHPYLIYLGVLNVDITTKQLNDKLKGKG
jgi:hypothetical protein